MGQSVPKFQLGGVGNNIEGYKKEALSWAKRIWGRRMGKGKGKSIGKGTEV